MRLYLDDPLIAEHIKDDRTGLELESHRVDPQGNLAQTRHPFPGNPYIDRDFSETQTEINTPPAETPGKALGLLEEQLETVHRVLRADNELLWPFSNPPILRGEEDIPIASFTGDQLPSYTYRVYLAQKYGKYKMTYSGIHFNYSFSESLLRRNLRIAQSRGKYRGLEPEEYRDLFYLRLAEKVLCYSWVVVSLLAASPLVDSSFYEAGRSGSSLFTGAASLRCSESGYWNPFLPVLSYESVDKYISSIEQYVELGLLSQARELYYPVRIKPAGKYSLDALREKGIDHIELRQVDLNPLSRSGIELADLEFLQLFLIRLSCMDMERLDAGGQIRSLQNHKSAAAYDWDLARISLPGKETASLRHCLDEFLCETASFYAGDPEASAVVDYQKSKLQCDGNRYASRVRSRFEKDYIGEGLRRAVQIQETFHV